MNEYSMIITTCSDKQSAKTIVNLLNHSYEVPEIIQIPITDGLPEYLKWIDDNTKGCKKYPRKKRR